MTPRNAGSAASLLAWLGAVVVMAAVVAATVWAGLTQAPTYLDAADARAGVEAEAGAGESPVAPGPVAVAAAEGGPWAPGTTFHLTESYPEPGVPFTVTECTSTFSFGDAAGRSYAVTAGHCGATGELVWPTTASTVQDFSAEVGRVIYTDLVLIADVYHDVGVIEITDPARPMTFAGTAEQPADLLVGDPGLVEGERVCKTGGTTGVTCGLAGGPERQQLHNDEGGVTLTEGRTAAVCATHGDSGGPVTATVGGRSVIVGLVSGTRSPGAQPAGCADPAAAGMTLAYTPTAKIVDIVREVVPDARITPLS